MLRKGKEKVAGEAVAREAKAARVVVAKVGAVEGVQHRQLLALVECDPQHVTHHLIAGMSRRPCLTNLANMPVCF